MTSVLLPPRKQASTNVFYKQKQVKGLKLHNTVNRAVANAPFLNSDENWEIIENTIIFSLKKRPFPVKLKKKIKKNQPKR